MMGCRTLFWSLAVSLPGILVGCAAPQQPVGDPSYAVLLASPDGRVGKVVVTGAQGTQVLDQLQHGALLDGSQSLGFVDEAKLKRDFAAAMAARPENPEHFVLYFETGGTKLTQQSLEKLPEILDLVAKRAAVDVSIIGHSDTVGKAEVNEAISLKRAQLVADLLLEKGLKLERLSVESHGETNLLVKTPDETPEPRNRRVEVTIR